MKKLIYGNKKGVNPGKVYIDDPIPELKQRVEPFQQKTYITKSGVYKKMRPESYDQIFKSLSGSFRWLQQRQTGDWEAMATLLRVSGAGNKPGATWGHVGIVHGMEEVKAKGKTPLECLRALKKAVDEKVG